MNKKSFISGRRVLLLLFITVFVNCEIIYGQWKKEQCQTTNDLNSVFFRNIGSGWIVGEKGTILKKTERGWEEVQKPTEADLYSVVMIEDEAWAVGAHGTIVHFDGKSWKIFDCPTRNNLYSVSFSDIKNGIAVGDFGTILSFKDGRWNTIGSGIRGRLFTVSAKKDDIWIGGGLECVNIPIMKIGIQNKTKTVIASYDSYATINSLMFLNPENGWAVGSPGRILHFDGQQWESVAVNEKYPSMNSLYFTDDNKGISVGYSGTILIYDEDQWKKEKSGTDQDLKACFKIGNSFYAVGKNGTILSRNQEQLNSTQINSEQKSEDIRLFPDPCDNVLNILLPRESTSCMRTITVSNISGQVLIQKEVSGLSGDIAYSLPTSELRNGIYLLRVETGQESTTKRFIVGH